MNHDHCTTVRPLPLPPWRAPRFLHGQSDFMGQRFVRLGQIRLRVLNKHARSKGEAKSNMKFDWLIWRGLCFFQPAIVSSMSDMTTF